MSIYEKILASLPSVAGPSSYLNFSSRLKWTGLILFLFLVMGQITLWGVSQTSLQQFQTFEMILGSSLGSIITLGIGPIVTASIILQLLAGSKIIDINTSTDAGKAKFQGTQKLLAVLFCLFEAVVFVGFGAVTPVNQDFTTMGFLVLQLSFGALILLFMDEVVSKWGMGSGISLFIAAGVSKTIFVRAFNPLAGEGSEFAFGLIPQAIQYVASQQLYEAFTSFLPVISTIIVFFMVVYIQAMKVQIPLAFASVRGFARSWPLKLTYTSNIPVILIAALLANIQLIGHAVARETAGALRCGILGCYDGNNQAVSGVVHYLQVPRETSIEVFFTAFLLMMFASALVAYYMKYPKIGQFVAASFVVSVAVAVFATASISGLPNAESIFRAAVYFMILVAGSVLFSAIWVTTSGMDARTVAGQIESMGMQVPGFRRDPRIVEQVLNRYIPSLTIISGLLIGTLAALGDFTGALGTGTGILLTVMIIYNFYEQISQKYVEDMNPAIRKFFE